MDYWEIDSLLAGKKRLLFLCLFLHLLVFELQAHSEVIWVADGIFPNKVYLAESKWGKLMYCE